MKIFINNPVLSTWIFITIFLVVLFYLRSSKKERGVLSSSVTQELKGFAILAIIFAHIGYFLVEGDSFLFPISIFAGVGVNMFLFLSGYGLSVSSSKNQESVWGFYKKRLLKLYTPLWMTLIVFIVLDYFVFHITYSLKYLIQAFSGIFLSADMFTDLNSNFWYMSLILLYYILFPLLYFKKYPWVTAVILYVVSYCVVYMNPVLFDNVDTLYKVHLVAFPLGVLSAWFFSTVKIKITLQNIIERFKTKSYFFSSFLCKGLLTVLLIFIAFGGYYSGVGQTVTKEQTIGLLVMLAIISVFILKRKQFNMFYIFGIYSYPIYLIHWPIVSRYDFLFKYIPGWISLILYLALFLGFGWLIQNILKRF